jgi:hypothetical protein
MSKNTPTAVFEFAAMLISDIQNIEGKLLTIVESLGLQTKQEEATKSLVRQAVWDEVYKPYRVWVSQVEVEAAHKAQELPQRWNTAPSKKLK